MWPGGAIGSVIDGLNPMRFPGLNGVAKGF
ncbi:hypothetical protein AXFE_17470 [Acidithrix ferrooxidans]|uniref:Uncharacterized protein n=1 Tax=Acidithrix ferrooxidans TaxID=1280514 RepID=A0A0D8HHS3_9ACTN|nr:hypothetical protein AXFE_17470 [Acidithrix ferrooxidans]